MYYFNLFQSGLELIILDYIIMYCILICRYFRIYQVAVYTFWYSKKKKQVSIFVFYVWNSIITYFFISIYHETYFADECFALANYYRKNIFWSNSIVKWANLVYILVIGMDICWGKFTKRILANHPLMTSKW